MTAGLPGEQLCWSRPWTRFSARTVTPSPACRIRGPAGTA